MAQNPTAKSTPLVSFLIPTYNRSDFLVKAVESILAQTYKNIEIIVIDDASTDDTESLINSRFGGRIKYHKNDTNRGVAYSRNMGLGYASGEYIGLLDSDDIILDPGYVAMAVSTLLAEPEICLFTCDLYCIDLNGNKIYDKTFFQATVDHRDIELSTGIKDFEYVFCHGVHSCGAIFKKFITQEIGFLNTEYKIAWDEDFFLRVAAVDKFKIYYYNLPAMGYRVHSNNISNSSAQLYREKIKTRKNIIKLNNNLKRRLGRRFNMRMGDQYYCLIDACLREKRIFASFLNALKAISMYPPILALLIKKSLNCPFRVTKG